MALTDSNSSSSRRQRELDNSLTFSAGNLTGIPSGRLTRAEWNVKILSQKVSNLACNCKKSIGMTRWALDTVCATSPLETNE